MNAFSSISPSRLAELAAQGQVDVIDVRTPAEYREAHATFARNVPLDQLDPARLREHRNGAADQPIYVICHRGNRSAQACEKLMRGGLVNVINVEGGTQAWIDAGLDVVRGKKTISLERQVRIAAGSIVFIGAVLALVVHPYFAAISAFVGTGLVFAGVTDTCGMGMLLAKMPWNRVAEPSGEGAACCSR